MKDSQAARNNLTDIRMPDMMDSRDGKTVVCDGLYPRRADGLRPTREAGCCNDQSESDLVVPRDRAFSVCV